MHVTNNTGPRRVISTVNDWFQTHYNNHYFGDKVDVIPWTLLF